MTAALESRPQGVPSVAAVAIVAGGAALLVARPLLAFDGHPTPTLITLFLGLLVVGSRWPLTRSTTAAGAGTVSVLVAVALGVTAFGLGRLLGGGHSPAPVTARVLALNSLAAVAEEAFFRRFTFAVLAPGGAAAAVGGSALLFAVVHVTVYGWWVLPIDLAAGLLLGWQRLATGRWWVPAMTHIAANVLVVI